MLAEARHHPYPTNAAAKSRADVQRLAEEYARTGDPSLREDVVAGCTHWSHAAAGSLARTARVEVEDLRQVAALALLRALERYDPAIGPFEPYARATVSGELRHHLRSTCWALRVSRRQQEAWRSLAQAREELSRDGNVEPTLADLAEAAGMGADEAASLAAVPRRALSLDQLALTITGAGVMGSDDHDLEVVPDRVDLRAAVATLDGYQRSLIELYFGRDLSQQQIATALGRTQVTISRHLSKTVDRLRLMLDPG